MRGLLALSRKVETAASRSKLWLSKKKRASSLEEEVISQKEFTKVALQSGFSFSPSIFFLFRLSVPFSRTLHRVFYNLLRYIYIYTHTHTTSLATQSVIRHRFLHFFSFRFISSTLAGHSRVPCVDCWERKSSLIKLSIFINAAFYKKIKIIFYTK